MHKIIVGILACTLVMTTAGLPLVGMANVGTTAEHVQRPRASTGSVRSGGGLPVVGQFPWLFLNLDWDYWTYQPNMYAIPTGNIGIGTTSPTEKLQVAGTIHATAGGFRFPDGTLQTTAASGGGGGDNDWDWSSGSGIIGDIFHIGDVGIGTTSPQSKLDVAGDIRITNPSDSNDYLRISSGDASTSLTHLKDGGTVGGVSIDSSGKLSAESLSSWFGLTAETGDIIVKQGRVGVGTTSPSYQLDVTADGLAVHGHSVDASGVWGSSDNYIGVYGSGQTFDFYAGGAGTNYGPFTGSHEVRFSHMVPEEIRPGTIVSVTGQNPMRSTAEGIVSFSSTLPTVKLSDTPADKKVLGVVVQEHSLDKDHWYVSAITGHDRFGIVNALGDGRVWVTNINGDIEAGDYITTSSVAGYGQRQNDDLLHSYTLGKATETINWDTVTETVVYEGNAYKAYPIAVVYTSG